MSKIIIGLEVEIDDDIYDVNEIKSTILENITLAAEQLEGTQASIIDEEVKVEE